jgi:heterodisulfide reductase subunit C
MEKLKLNKETLKLLTETEAQRVAGGLAVEGFSEIAGCSEGGGVCTSGCPTRASEVFAC